MQQNNDECKEFYEMIFFKQTEEEIKEIDKQMEDEKELVIAHAEHQAEISAIEQGQTGEQQ